MRYGNATRYNGRWPLALLVPLALAALAMLLAVPPAGAQSVDYDADDDGLIEITTLAQLRAIDYDRNGDGMQGSETVPNWAMHTAAFPNSASGMGCPAAGCTGYEIIADLDFDTNDDGSVGAGDDYPSGFRIGGYDAILRGNGHRIANHYYRRSNADAYVSHGLIDSLGNNGRIHGLALTDVDVRHTGAGGGGSQLGALTGTNNGRITAVYVTGSISTTLNDHEVGAIAGSNGSSGFIGASYSTASVAYLTNNQVPSLGAIVGWNHGVIHAVYATGAVSTHRANGIGGLVGSNWAGAARVRASYSTGRVSYGHGSTGRGGALGRTGNGGQAAHVYHDRQRSGLADLGGGTAAYPGRDLRRPTDYSGIYADWNVDIDGDTMTDDDPWDFGGPRDYPLLQVDFNSDGVATWQEFGDQYRYEAPLPPYNPAHDHPEIYANPRYEMATSCEVRTTGEGDDAKSTSTLTFDLGSYTRPITLALSLWDGTHFRSLQSQGINMPELRQDGQTATVEVVTDPAQTRFRLDSEYGLNLVLGYADCHTDDP